MACAISAQRANDSEKMYKDVFTDKNKIINEHERLALVEYG